MTVVLSDRDALAIHDELEFLFNSLDAYREPCAFKDFEQGRLLRLMQRLKREPSKPRELFSVVQK